MHFTKQSRYLELMISVPMNTMYVTQVPVVILECLEKGL